MLSLLSYRGFRACVWAIYALGILYTMAVFIPGSGYLADNTGREVKPPVAYRVLVRTLHNATYGLVPYEVEKKLLPTLKDIRDNRDVKRILKYHGGGVPYRITDQYLMFTTIKILWCVIWYVAFLVMLIKMARAFFPTSEAIAVVAPLLFLWILPTFFHRYAYTYDFAELFFATACMYLLYIKRWWWYIGCFVLATLTKETSIFMMVFFAIWYLQRMPRALYVQLLLLQFVLYVSMEAVIMSSYAEVAYTHGGSGLRTFWRLFRQHYEYAYGYNFFTVMSGLGLFMLLGYRWQEKPDFLLGCLWMALVNFVVFVICCNKGEYRDLFWSMPSMVLLATHSVVSLLDMDKWPLFERLNKAKAT